MKKMRGFTIIEIMIVVAVLGILAAVAIPAYSNYTVRSRVTEMLTAMSKARTCVQEWNQDRMRIPGKGSVTSDTLISLNYSRSIQWDGKAVVVEANPDDLGAKLVISLVAEVHAKAGKSIITGWTCAVAEPDMFRHVPANCRNIYSDFDLVADTDTEVDTVADANTGNSSDNRNENGQSSSNNSGNGNGNNSGNSSDNRNENGQSSSNNSGNGNGNNSGNSSDNRNENGQSSSNNSGNGNGNG